MSSAVPSARNTARYTAFTTYARRNLTRMFGSFMLACFAQELASCCKAKVLAKLDSAADRRDSSILTLADRFVCRILHASNAAVTASIWRPVLKCVRIRACVSCSTLSHRALKSAAHPCGRCPTLMFTTWISIGFMSEYVKYSCHRCEEIAANKDYLS